MALLVKNTPANAADRRDLGVIPAHAADRRDLGVIPAHAADRRDLGVIPGSRRPPGGVYGNPLQYSWLENPMDRGAWWATVHKVAKSQTPLKQMSTLIEWDPPSLVPVLPGYTS